MLSVPILVFHHLLLLLMLQMCIIAFPSCLYLFVLTIRAYFKRKKKKIEKKATKRKRKKGKNLSFPVGDGPRISQAVSLSLSLSINPSFSAIFQVLSLSLSFSCKFYSEKNKKIRPFYSPEN
ncbi:unnamed protein product [Brassica rapa subsp. narinosa]